MATSVATTDEALAEAKWTAATRKAYHDEHPENFAGPDGSFPIKDASDVADAWDLAGHTDDPDAVRARIIAIAKRLGFSHALPDTANDFGKKKESAQILASPTSVSPKAKIATIQVCWIEDYARSLNNRIYSTEAVDALIASAQRKIADPNGLNITCFLTHADADQDAIRHLVGRITKVWREGSKGYALIDIADTAAGRDVVALIVGGYLYTESLRARGGKQVTDRRYNAPVVVPDGTLELDGIDLTTMPGLEAVARITQLRLTEAAPASDVDVFVLSEGAITIEKGHAMSTKSKDALREDVIPAAQLGDPIPGMVGAQTGDTYQQTMMQKPPVVNFDQQGADPAMTEAVQHAHDHSAAALGYPCAPKEAMAEAGRAFSKKNAQHLHGIHEKAAHALNMDCEGKYSPAQASGRTDPDGDGDDDSTNDPAKNPDAGQDAADRANANNLESTKGPRRMAQITKEEALRVLAAEGYEVRRPKTQAELLQERIDAQDRQLAEIKALLEAKAAVPAAAAPAQSPAQPPQRRSLVEGATNSPLPFPDYHQPLSRPFGRDAAADRPPVVHYRNGDYLRERHKEIDWAKLSDRSCPIPDDINIDWMINELAQAACAMVEEKWQPL